MANTTQSAQSNSRIKKTLHIFSRPSVSKSEKCPSTGGTGPLGGSTTATSFPAPNTAAHNTTSHQHQIALKTRHLLRTMQPHMHTDTHTRSNTPTPKHPSGPSNTPAHTTKAHQSHITATPQPDSETPTHTQCSAFDPSGMVTSARAGGGELTGTKRGATASGPRPQLQFIGRVVDIPVVHHRQVPTVQTLQKTVGIPQVQFLDNVVDVPVVVQRHMPTVLTCRKPLKFRSCRSSTRLSTSLSWGRSRSQWSKLEIPQL